MRPVCIPVTAGPVIGSAPPCGLLRAALAALLLLLSAATAGAQPQAGIDALIAALRFDDLLPVLRDEGVAHGAALWQDELGGAPATWTAEVAAIHDPVRMEASLRASLGAALAGVDLAPVLAFLGTEPGRALVRLEVSARRAMLDPDVTDAARATAVRERGATSSRLELVEGLIAANDLIESNVGAALNANLAFMSALLAGGAMPPGTTEADLLRDLWAQEDAIRAATAEWAYSYLLLAYAPASDADLASYVAFSRTPAGQALNRALFLAFGGLYDTISAEMGAAMARHLLSRAL
ncbi:MAG: DUF2059 domain-containing protein [Rubellimicrobium sp.]|nr:DUF2059 domain-containing protein [Rubellimicrobium sp.]